MLKFRDRRYLILIGDLVVIVVSLFISYILRLDLWLVLAGYIHQAFVILCIALLVKPLIYYFFGLYRILWRYAGMREYRRVIIAGLSAAMVVWLLAIFAVNIGWISVFPRSVIMIDWILSTLGILGLRLLVRRPISLSG